MSGAEALNEVAPGVYLLRLGYGNLPPAFKTIEVASRDASADIDLRYDRWFGKVTRDHEPLHAQVGIGIGAVTDPETGEYFTISTPVPPPPPDAAARMFKDPSPIAVVGCDSDVDMMFIPDEKPVPNSRFDIEIMPNVVRVRVVDAKASAPIKGAAIQYSVPRRDLPDAAIFAGTVGKTDERGELTVSDVPPNRQVLLCASHEEYHKACADPISMKATRKQDVTIALERADLRKGRVLDPAAGGGRVLWYRPDGRITEAVTIGADGTFTYKNAHAQGEIVCMVSAGAPLFVFRQPWLADGETFDISFPSTPVRSFSVTLPAGAKETKGFFSLSVGDIVVPLNVLSDHLRTRGSRPLFLSPGVVTVRDIVASGPVSLIFAPMSWAEIYQKNLDVDVFYVPAATALPRVPAGLGADVTIGE